MAVRVWVYLPLIGGALLWGAHSHAPALRFPGGVLVWTLLEYLIHRFAFHGFAPHWQHHEDPQDPLYILAPLWLSLGASALIWLVAGPLLAAGVMCGYLAYEAIHLRIHGSRPGSRLLRALRRHHYYHHFASDRVCYGVTSPLWDEVFQTCRVSPSRAASE